MAQNEEATVTSIQGWKIYGGLNSSPPNRDLESYFANSAVYPNAEAACEVAAAYLVDNDYSTFRGHVPTLSSTRSVGVIKYYTQVGVAKVTGRKCAISNIATVPYPEAFDYPRDLDDNYVIYESGNAVSQRSLNTGNDPGNADDYDLWTQSWVGSYAAIPVCASGFSPDISNGEILCIKGGNRQTTAPDCEGTDGDSPKSTPPKKCVGNPIAIDSGAKQDQVIDYATVDGLMSVQRKYRSNSRPKNLSDSITEIPGFGLNWRGLLPGRITVKQGYPANVEFLNDEGGVRRFSIYDNGPGDTLIEATGVPTRLTLALNQVLTGNIDDLIADTTSNTGPGDLRLAYANGDYILFRRAGELDAQNQTRNFVPIEHGLASGYTRWFDYPDTGQYPNKIRDSLGREMTIDWTEIGWASSSLVGYYKAPNQPIAPAGMTLEKAVSAIMLPDGTRLVYGYGASTASGFLGRLETAKRVDASNEVLWGRTYLYEDIRFKTAITGMLDQNGARLSTYAYNENGQATSTARAGGFDYQQISYSTVPESPENYDRPVDIRDVTNPLGLSTRYTYSAFSENHSSESPGPDPRKTPRRLLAMQSQATLLVPERTQAYEYDDDGLKTAQTNANGRRIAQENIPDEGRPSTMTDATGVTTLMEWHPDFDLPTRETRKSLQTNYGYSSQGQLTSITLVDTATQMSRTTVIEYGIAGRLLSINGPRALDAEGRDDITTMTYDAQGNRMSMTNPLGHLTRFEGYDANGRPSRIIDANGIATEFTYDKLGRVKTTSIKHPTDPVKDAVTALDYDVEGRITAMTLPATATLRFDYNLAGLLTAIRSDDGERIDYTHDPMGNVLTETVKRADSTQARGIIRTFDELGRLVTLTLGPNRISRYEYDNVGNPTKITSARGNAVDQAFDPLNRLLTTLAPDGGKTAYGYAGGTLAATGGGTTGQPVSTGNGDSPANELGAFRDPNGVTTRFTRNAFGQITQEISPDRGTILYEYDAAGDLMATVDGRGQRMEFIRDILGRVISKRPVGRPQSERITYTYDTPVVNGSFAVGRLSRVDDGSGATRFGYDHRGNLDTRLQKLLGTFDWVALNYRYDLADRIETVTYPSGRQVRYVRDTKGRVAAVRTRANSSVATWTNVATGISYEPFGAQKAMTLSNGERSVTNYNEDGRLASRRLYKVADGNNISHLSYGYDADDNIVRITDNVDASRTQNFGYDEVGRLTRVTSASGAMRRTDYLFDGNGNRMRVLTRPLPEDPASAATADRYTLEAGTNRLSQVRTPAGVRNFTHDARGNLAGETRPGGVTVSAGYDGQGRLISYARSGEPSLTHAYNGLDDRVATTRDSDTRRFVYAPDGRVLGEYGNNANDVKAEFIWLSPEVGDSGMFGGDDGLGGYMPLAVAVPDPIVGAGATQLTWVYASHMGVPIRYSDATGNTLTSPTGFSLPGFPGQSQTMPDLYYNRYRDYDPVTGRYIQADPIGLDGGASPYSYGINNPIRYTDPKGQFVPLALCAIGAAAGGIGTVVGEVAVGGGFNLNHAFVGLAAGCVSGVAAPLVATSALGATALGALVNTGQYAATQFVDGDCITLSGLALNAVFGAGTGKLTGAFKPRLHEWAVDPGASLATQALHRSLNGERIIDAARRGFGGSVGSGVATTVAGYSGLWSKISELWNRIF